MTTAVDVEAVALEVVAPGVAVGAVASPLEVAVGEGAGVLVIQALLDLTAEGAEVDPPEHGGEVRREVVRVMAAVEKVQAIGRLERRNRHGIRKGVHSDSGGSDRRR